MKEMQDVHATKRRPPSLPQRLASVLAVALVLSMARWALADDTWHQRYNEARGALLEDRNDEAAKLFDELERTAPTSEDRKVAAEFAQVARERAGILRRQMHDPHIRTPDELSLLYTTAFIYGFGTSSWLALQIRPKNVAAAVVPYLLITTATVGGVAVADNYRPFRLGVPQAMTAGMFLGLGEGVWLVGSQHAAATRRDDGSHWKSAAVSTLLWTGASVGLLAGSAAAAWFEPLPGQVSLTASGAMWGGIGASLLGSAFTRSNDRRPQIAFVTGAVGYNTGLIAAALASPTANPSVARVRFVDLGGLAGGLLGAGGYLLAAGDSANPRLGFGAAAVGALGGLAFSWWATDDMKPAARDPHEETSTASSLRPGVSPVEGGWLATLSGSL